MPALPRRPIGLLLTALTLAPLAAAATSLGPEDLPRALPTALQAERHPRLFVAPEDLATGRRNAQDTAWGRAYLARQKAAAARFVPLSDTALRALVPKPGSLFIYGLGMNLDPIRQRRMTWAGWDDPFAMRAADRTRFPNNAWPDAGDGIVDPKSKERYYFVAQANGQITQALEQTVLPALADVYALAGSRAHAHAAAVLLDALAAVYPTNRRGPLDYPTSPSDFDRGGRLDRPYYQTARGLVNYGFVVDLVAASGEFDRPSAYGAFPIRTHIARNLLWDGGAYCHEFAVRGYQLHNGHADYLRGAALVGVLLDVPALAAPMFAGPLSLPAMLDVNIDRNGFYYETSPGYATHNRTLYVDLAELFVAMRRLGWRDVPDAYAHPNLRLYLTAPFNRQEIGGHVPAIGDDGPDKGVVDPTQRTPARPATLSDSFMAAQIEATWVQLVRGGDRDRAAAAALLASCGGAAADGPAPGSTRWSVYHVTPAALALVAGRPPDPAQLATTSVCYGAKGLALLRGGTGNQRYGAQLYFGPGHNHSQRESLTWTFFSRGAEWSYDPGYFNKHYRMSWTTQTVAHLALTVDGRSHPWENGTARVLAWQTDPALQWVMAAHPDLYDDLGVTRYERLLAQVHNPATGEPAYWLDLGRLEGGRMRDDSFHTQMQAVTASVPLPARDPARPALFGDRDLGAAVLPSYYVTGFDPKIFYLVTPGEGYGFLGSPREISLDRPVRLVLSDPLFAASLPGAHLVVDYLGAPGRRLIVADGGTPFGVPRVPYLIQRDTGAGGSTFTKVLRVVDSPATDPILDVEAISADSRVKPFLVRWRSGRRDLWIISDETGSWTTCRAPGLPEVKTDARVACVQFDSTGIPRQIHASAASALSIAGGPQLSSPGVLRGRVVSVGRTSATLHVRWDSLAATPPPGSALITTPAFGASATWEVAAAAAETVTLADATCALAQTEMRPVPGKAGAFTFAAGISRFYSGGSRLNTRYALGKAVYAGDTFVGRVRSISGAKELEVVLEGAGVTQIRAPTVVRILEVAAGDAVSVPTNLTWSAPLPAGTR